MGTPQDTTGAAVDAIDAIDAVDAVDVGGDVELIRQQIAALKELAATDDHEPISEGRRYDISIRWGTVLAGRLRRLVHYSSSGRLDDAGERRFQELCQELRTLSPVIDRFRLAQPDFTDGRPAKAKRFRPRR
jgi:hypothetical protein